MIPILEMTIKRYLSVIFALLLVGQAILLAHNIDHILSNPEAGCTACLSQNHPLYAPPVTSDFITDQIFLPLYPEISDCIYLDNPRQLYSSRAPPMPLSFI